MIVRLLSALVGRLPSFDEQVIRPSPQIGIYHTLLEIFCPNQRSQ